MSAPGQYCRTFPVEILGQIVLHVRNADLSALAAACRAAQHEAERRMYRVVRLDLLYASGYEPFKALLALLAADARRAMYVREPYLPGRIPQRSLLGTPDTPLPFMIERALSKMPNLSRLHVRDVGRPEWLQKYRERSGVPEKGFERYALTHAALLVLPVHLHTFLGGPPPWSKEYAVLYSLHTHMAEWSIAAVSFPDASHPLPPASLPALSTLHLDPRSLSLKHFAGRPVERLRVGGRWARHLDLTAQDFPFVGFARSLRHLCLVGTTAAEASFHGALRELARSRECSLRSLTILGSGDLRTTVPPSLLGLLSAFSSLATLVVSAGSEGSETPDVPAYLQLLQKASGSLDRVALKKGPWRRWECFKRNWEAGLFEMEGFDLLDEHSWRTLE